MIVTNIESEQEYQILLDRINDLMQIDNDTITQEETNELETLAKLVDLYEDLAFTENN